MIQRDLLVFIVTVAAVQSSIITPIFYDVFGLVSFNGSNLTNTSEGCSLFGISLACLNSSNGKLTDGNIGPVTSISGSLGQFFAFGRQSSNNVGRVTFTLPGSVSTVVLYFFNSPNTSIGLPMISVFATMGNPVGYFFANNDDLSQTDSQLRNVTLHLQQLTSAVQLDFTFTNQSAIDWLLLSEVILYNDTVVSPSMDNIIFDQGNTSTIQIGPANLQSSITLTCSVINSGSFVWQWMYNGDMLYTGDQFQILIKDATRTSTLTINQLQFNYSGNYTCIANSNRREIILQLIANLSVANSNITSDINTPVSMTCELTGYVISFDIIWMRNNITLTSNSKYTVNQSMGTNNIINAAGDISPSVISTLTIISTAEQDSGVYTCRVPDIGLMQNVSLSIVTGTSTKIDVPTSVFPPATSLTLKSDVITTTVTSSMITVVPTASSTIATSSTGGNTGTVQPFTLEVPTIIGLVVGFIVVLVFLNIVLIVVLYCCCFRRRNRLPNSPHSKEIIQPYSALPNKNNSTPNHSYSETEFLTNGKSDYCYIDQSDVIDNSTIYQEIPELPPPPLARSTLTNQTFLQDNPKYASADNLTTREENDLKSSADYGGSSFNIYASPNLPPPVPEFRGSAYSEDLNPSHFKSQELIPNQELPGLHPYCSIYADPLPLQRSDVLEVQEDNINIIKELGVGQFGTVVLAYTIGLSLKDLGIGNDNSSFSILVAVKMLHFDADDMERQAFEREIKFMSRLKHENVVSILGVCLDTNAFIIMEYMEKGDLNQFLQKYEFTPDNETIQLDRFVHVGILVYISLQIASGMRYLAEKKYVHRDLATRNCLVGRNYLVKIADFGMSRELYDNSYYRIRGKAMLPIRWMAKECFYGRFSEKTDVWAFGVVMWEVFTLCKCQPYDQFDDQEVIDNAVCGPGRVLLQQPHPCPDEVYYVMLRCWVDDMNERANFEEIHGSLSQIHAYSDSL